jgi:hypothetical protein
MPSPDEQEATMIAKLPEQTGRSLEAWRKVIAASGMTSHGQIVALLKTEYAVTHGYANLIAHKARASDAASASADDLVEAQYSGSRAAMKPLYVALMREVLRFGSDVEVAPKKAYVSLRRAKQFALIQPAASRLDVGINLKGEKATARLETAGSFNAMVSHRVRVSTASEIDEQLLGWLKDAYDRSG